MGEKNEEYKPIESYRARFLYEEQYVCDENEVRELEQAYKDKCNQLDMAVDLLKRSLSAIDYASRKLNSNNLLSREIPNYLSKLKDNQDGE